MQAGVFLFQRVHVVFELAVFSVNGFNVRVNVGLGSAAGGQQYRRNREKTQAQQDVGEGTPLPLADASGSFAVVLQQRNGPIARKI
jgi:hypothetical protein